MVFRVLILLMVMLCTSCDGLSPKVEDVGIVSCGQSTLRGDDSDDKQNLHFSWLGLCSEGNTPEVRTFSRLRPVQRHVEKRKPSTNCPSAILLTANSLHHSSIIKRQLCNPKNLGESLLYLICVLRL